MIFNRFSLFLKRNISFLEQKERGPFKAVPCLFFCCIICGMFIIGCASTSQHAKSSPKRGDDFLTKYKEYKGLGRAGQVFLNKGEL